MVKFLSQKLSSAIQGPYVMFTVDVELQFEPNERGKDWRIELILMEYDRFTRDDVLRTKNLSRTFKSSRETISFQFDAPIHRFDVNTEPGKEEVYAKLTLVSLDGSIPALEVKTNRIKIAV